MMKNVKVKFYEYSFEFATEETDKEAKKTITHTYENSKGDLRYIVCAEDKVIETKNYILDDMIGDCDKAIKHHQKKLEKLNSVKTEI